MDHRLFNAMGTPVQPFIALITGEKGSGKSILATLICGELIKWFKSKILFVVDNQNQGAVLEYFAKGKVSTDLLSIKFADTLSDIEKALANDKYEFMSILGFPEIPYAVLNQEKLPIQEWIRCLGFLLFIRSMYSSEGN